ncbi:DUF2892 domain-containing protein [Halovenus rubra]|uniref:DUF2892 domain-containing protein n=2 Tax=Halovenus rubra TaxID=869890 RepID=A0ACC7E300_9EURY|nr:DUF2892 domain-containing protein [Halovenus rubra]
MSQNVGATDKRVRTGLGAVLGIGALVALAGSFSVPMILAPIFGIISLVLLVTAATGTCGLYSLIGVDTCSMNSGSPR